MEERSEGTDAHISRIVFSEAYLLNMSFIFTRRFTLCKNFGGWQHAPQRGRLSMSKSAGEPLSGVKSSGQNLDQCREKNMASEVWGGR